MTGRLGASQLIDPLAHQESKMTGRGLLDGVNSKNAGKRDIITPIVTSRAPHPGAGVVEMPAGNGVGDLGICDPVSS